MNTASQGYGYPSIIIIRPIHRGLAHIIIRILMIIPGECTTVRRGIMIRFIRTTRRMAGVIIRHRFMIHGFRTILRMCTIRSIIHLRSMQTIRPHPADQGLAVQPEIPSRKTDLDQIQHHRR